MGRRPRLRVGGGSVRRWTSADLVTGGVIGGMEALFAISFAGLVFSGALAPAAGTLIGTALVSAVVVLLLTSHRTTLPDALGSVQDASAAILVVVTAGVVAQLGPDHPGLVGTALVAVAATTATTGLLLWGIGRFHLGQVVRYVPYPVVGGFLAGSGWLLLAGGVDLLATDLLAANGALAAIREVGTDPARGGQVLLGLAFAVGLLVGQRRGLGGSLLPIASVTAIVGFHLVAAVGPGLDAMRDAGWLLGPFPTGALWPPDPSLLADVQLGAVASQGVAILMVAALSAVSLLLTASGIELSTGADADMDQELRVAGSANLLVAATGGVPGFHALSLSDLVRRAGASGRHVGLVAAGVLLVALIFGSGPISAVPRFVVGGLLAYLGLSFLVEWLVDGWTTLERVDYGLVLVIVVVIAAVGFLPGVAVGLVLTAALFLVTYSRTEVVRTRRTGATTPSRLDRSVADQTVLEGERARIAVLELQGFLFFGTGHGLAEEVRRLLEEAPTTAFVVLDLSRVTGVDSSAVRSLARILQRLARAEVDLVLAGGGDRIARSLRADPEAPHDRLRLTPDLDHAMQWCEEQLLARATPSADPSPTSLRDLLRDELGSDALVARLEAVLERQVVPAGTRILTRGDDDRDLYLVEHGRLTVHLPGPDGTSIRIRELHAGTVIGEIGLELGVPRAADVVADSEVVLLRLPADALARLEVDDPPLASAVHRALARLLARRLVTSLRTIEALER